MKKIDYDKELEIIKELVEIEDMNSFKELRKEYVEEEIKEEQDLLEKQAQIQKWLDMMESQCTEEQLAHSDTYLYTKPRMQHKEKPIKEMILDNLEKSGYNLEEKGTMYLADLATMLFQERKLFGERLYSENIKEFWDLDENDNVHYRMLGNNPDEVILSIEDSINNSEENEAISTIVYSLVDKFGYLKRDKDNPNRVSYMEEFKPNKVNKRR